MFKFLRKIFFILILIGLFFAWIYFKDDSKKQGIENIMQADVAETISSLFSVDDGLKEKVQSIFNMNDKVEFDEDEEKNGYKLDSLKNKKDKLENEKQQFGGAEDVIITLVNKERFDKGLDLLDKSKGLMNSSLAKAKDMKRDQYFEHISKQKIQPWFFVEEAGYQYEKFGENIALDYLSANSVHKAFMDSLGHRANILDENFKDIGVAILSTETKEGTKYIVVEHFGEKLKNINPEKKEKYSDKSKRYCKIQKSKKKELEKMIKNQKEVIKQFEEEINKKAIEEESVRLQSLREIKVKINGYLEDCKVLEEKYGEV